MTRCSFIKTRTLLFPEPELLEYLGAKAWKFQIVFAMILMVQILFSVVSESSIPLFYASVAFAFRCIILLLSNLSKKLFLVSGMACTIVDSFCIIMGHAEMQNTFYFSFYSNLPYNVGEPPCPHCMPNIEGSVMFGLNLSYMAMFVLPARHVAFTVPLCFAAYVSMLVNARFNHYVKYGSRLDSDVKSLTINELALLCVIVFFNLCAKVLMELSESELWYALKVSKGTVLQEKILRCQAEYASERMKTPPAAPRNEDLLSSHCATDVDSYHQTAKSAISAPPILEQQSMKGHHEEHCDPQLASSCIGDCLQEDDVVWTDEFPHPIPVKQLAKGQHVLCYDHLSKGLRQSEVLNVTTQVDSTQWATITLTDGTSIKVTVDHPFLTEANGNPPSIPGCGQVVVRACELKPHCSKVLVMKMVPVEVQSIKIDRPEDVKEQARVAIDVRQPRRHSVFVARKGQPMLESAVAVGASNLDVMTQDFGWPTSKTFLDIFEIQPAMRRSNSSPGCLQTNTKLSSQPCEDTCGRSSSSPSNLSDLSSEVPSAGADTYRIRIGSNLQPIRDLSGYNHAIHTMSVPDGERRVVLGDYLYLKRAGVPSIGSIQHQQGACDCTSVCWFENQRQHGRRKWCSSGIYCDRCHFDHDLLKRSRRTGKAQ